mmetsp:Transcript_15620/g.32551  ORF Transcript_15620/g.32551 Transcript_15620/m.32551 type:complete len:279 (+) Transcript_15620:297-1133(+)
MLHRLSPRLQLLSLVPQLRCLGFVEGLLPLCLSDRCVVGLSSLVGGRCAGWLSCCRMGLEILEHFLVHILLLLQLSNRHLGGLLTGHPRGLLDLFQFLLGFLHRFRRALRVDAGPGCGLLQLRGDFLSQGATGLRQLQVRCGLRLGRGRHGLRLSHLGLQCHGEGLLTLCLRHLRPGLRARRRRGQRCHGRRGRWGGGQRTFDQQRGLQRQWHAGGAQALLGRGWATTLQAEPRVVRGTFRDIAELRMVQRHGRGGLEVVAFPRAAGGGDGEEWRAHH